MLCIMCGKTITHELTCTNCGYNYSKAATLASLFELDVTTINDTLANKTQSLDYNTLLDRIRLERAGVADRERMQFEQTDSDVTMRPPQESEYTESFVVFELPSHVDHDNTTSNYPEVLSDVSNAIRIDPNNPYWYFLRAEINYSFGRTNLVRHDILHAIKLSPHLVDYYFTQVINMDKLSANDITIIERAGRYYQRRYHNTFSDKTIICKSCGQNFTLTAELQIYFAEHGTEEPQHCEDCRSAHRKVIRFAYPNRY